MEFAGLNYIAVLAAAAAGFVFGAIYYTVMGEHWRTAANLSHDDIDRSKPTPYVVAAVAQLVMAYLLAGLIGHLLPAIPQRVLLQNQVVAVDPPGHHVWPIGLNETRLDPAVTLLLDDPLGHRAAVHAGDLQEEAGGVVQGELHREVIHSADTHGVVRILEVLGRRIGGVQTVLVDY